MAIYIPSAIVGAISGALGGAVFVNAHGSKVVRHRPQKKRATPSHREPYIDRGPSLNGAATLDPKIRLQLLTAAWEDFSTNTQASWDTFAAQIPRVNRLGQRRPLSGRAAYISYGLQIWPALGIAPAADTPQFGVAPPLSLSLAFTEGGPYNITYVLRTGTGTERIIIKMAIGYNSKRRNAPPNFRLAGVLLASAISFTYNPYASWNPAYEHLRAGQQIWVSLIRLGTAANPLGWPSPPAIASTIVA